MTVITGYESNRRVRVHKDARAGTITVASEIKKLIDSLLYEKPLWEFELCHVRHNSTAAGFKVFKDDENLGLVRWAYVGSTMKYMVYNNRIAKAMEKREYYSTTDISKAALKIKKTFSNPTIGERLADAEGKAASRLYDARSAKFNELNAIKAEVNRAEVAYVQGAGQAAFIEFLLGTNPQMLNKVELREQLHTEWSHINALHSKFDTDKASVVLRYDSVYTVKTDGNIVRYTDADLPERMKRKIGMLKLVEKNQFVTGCGFKVDDETFVLEPEEKNDE